MKKLLITTALLLVAITPAKAEEIQQRDSIMLGDSSQDAFRNDMSQHFQSIFKSFFNHAFRDDNSAFSPLQGIGSTAYARTDMYETDKDIKISVEMPGIDKDDIDLEVVNNIISLKYQQQQEKRSDDKDYQLNERRTGSVSRQFSLPNYAKAEEAEAEYNNGVLNITIPKDRKKALTPRKIKIK